ncbi:hypothetical protein [Catenulispora pinisilvae]|uniref:hypothetical protein n=1 Tax=Catenulispora pinisilvae TaxID=2705253 RepID=UPI001891B028|nr:hypothetical protein [Catenulispora pinisilvae]
MKEFIPRFDSWVDLEKPDQHIRAAVMNWIMSRAETPYKDVLREPDFPNMWYGRIPRTLENDQIATCSYWIEEREHLVRCNMFSTLSWPA